MFTCTVKLFYILFGPFIAMAIPTTLPLKPSAARQVLEDTFNYDFYYLPKRDEIFVWKIPKTQLPYEMEDYSNGFIPFQKHEICLIFALAPGHKYMLFYRMGISATRADKKHAAKVAVFMQHYLNEHSKRGVELSRELEPYESDLYNFTLERLKKSSQPFQGSSLHCGYECVHIIRPNIYLIKGTELAVRIKKVVIKPHLLKKNNCIVIETGSCHIKNVTLPWMIYCGHRAPISVKRLALNMINIPWPKFKPLNIDLAVENNGKKVGIRFTNLMELLQNCEHKRPYDMDFSSDVDSNDREFVQLRDNVVQLFKFYKENEEMKTVKMNELITINTFNVPQACYLLDSSSAAGFFLMFGKKAELDTKVYAIESAENYVHNVVKSLKKPVIMRIESNWNNHSFDFLVNLVDGRPRKRF